MQQKNKFTALFALPCMVLIALVLSCQSTIAAEQYNQKSKPKLIRLVFSEQSCIPCNNYVSLLYDELFGQLGIDTTIDGAPSERAIVDANSGKFDGDAGRVRLTDAQKLRFDNLVIVPEEIINTEISAYTFDKSIDITSIDALISAKHSIGYVRGTQALSDILKKHKLHANIYDVSDTESAFKMFKNSRFDVLIGYKKYIDRLLNEDPDLQPYSIGYIYSNIILEVPIYLYLNKKYEQLVPEVSAILKSMKEKGAVARILNESGL